MDIIIFLIYILNLIFLFKIWRGLKFILISPARLWYFLNTIYFFILYFILYKIKYGFNASIFYEYTEVIVISIIILSSFTLFQLFFYFRGLKKINFNIPCIRINNINILLLLFVLLVLLNIYLYFYKYHTFNPLIAFSKSYLFSSENSEKGQYIFKYINMFFLWFLYLQLIFFYMLKKKWIHSFIILIIFIYISSFHGSKSSVLLPILYFFIIYLIIKKNISSKSVFIIFLILSIFILINLVILNEIRSGISNKNFIDGLFFRIDFFKTLQGYLNNYENFEILYPLKEFFLYFLPSKLADLLGIEKFKTSFDVVYTQFALHRYTNSSSAGVGFAVLVETLKPLINNIYLIAFIYGFLQSLFVKICDSLIFKEFNNNSILFFSIFVPAFHIIGFFELSLPLFFRIILFLSFGFTFIFFLGVLNIVKVYKCKKQHF